MSTGGPTAGTSGLDLTRVDEIRVTVALSNTPDAAPDEVLVLTVGPGSEDRPWQERAYVDAVDRLLRRAPLPPPRYTLRLTRTLSKGGRPASEAAVSLALAVPAGPSRDAVRLAALTALGELRVHEGIRPAARPGRDEALTTSRSLVADCWPDLATGDLSVSEEEHHHDTGVWTFGLVAADHSHVRVDVGVVDGDPATARLVHTAEAEVVDSVGL
jgi:hypothetical protein